MVMGNGGARKRCIIAPFPASGPGSLTENPQAAALRFPLTQNYRSRPEVLAAVNVLFGDDFGGDYQPLAASGDFPFG